MTEGGKPPDGQRAAEAGAPEDRQMLKVESSFDYPVAALGRLELRGADSLPHFHRKFWLGRWA